MFVSRKTYNLKMLVFALLGSTFPAVGNAHVKWFVEYDLSKPPLAIDQVLTNTFIYFFLASVVAVFSFLAIDRYAFRNGVGAATPGFRMERVEHLDGLSMTIMRVCAGVFFISVWLYNRVYGVSFLLTPELLTDQALVPWFQLALGLCAFSLRTTPLIGIGILALYIEAVSAYGIFHLLDYVIFLGIAYFFAIAMIDNRKWKNGGFTVLYVSAGITLLWASIEKFGYPDWTMPLLKSDPSLLMGLSPEVYMLLAGYVEFNVTFLMLTTASLFTRVIAFGLQLVFVLAIYKFGLVDAIGHLMIIAILTVLAIRGPNPESRIFLISEKSIWLESYFMVSLYCLSLVMFFVAYYGLYHLSCN